MRCLAVAEEHSPLANDAQQARPQEVYGQVRCLLWGIHFYYGAPADCLPLTVAISLSTAHSPGVQVMSAQANFVSVLVDTPRELG